jgi:plasmid segregation protein ParM
MYPTLPGRTIDYLVLGLPLTTIRNHAATIEKRFTGSLSINAQGHKLQVNHVEVFPQPLGSYMAYLAANPVSAGKKMPLALVIDPGFNTVDWYVIQGTTPSDMRSGAVQRGMGSVIKAIAEALIAPVAQGGAKEAQGATTKEIERRVDQSLTRGEPFTLCGHTIDLSKYMPAGNAVIEEAAQAVKNSIGLGGDIDVLVMTGGGAGMYTPAMQAQFPHHRVETLVDSAFANARGFHFLGERLARSAERATLSPVAVPA